MTGVDPHGARTPQDIPDLTLAEFLLARLDEDARVAQIAAAAARFPTWHQGATSDDDVVYPAGDLTDPGRCSEHPAGQPNMCDDNPAIGVDPDFVSDRNAPLIAEHIARHDPARVLRDVAAQRQIVGLLHHEPEVGIRAGTDHYVSCVCRWEQAIPNGLDWDFPYLEHLSVRHVSADPTVANAVLRLLAEVYADHPDYRSEWRPGA